MAVTLTPEVFEQFVLLLGEKLETVAKEIAILRDKGIGFMPPDRSKFAKAYLLAEAERRVELQGKISEVAESLEETAAEAVAEREAEPEEAEPAAEAPAEAVTEKAEEPKGRVDVIERPAEMTEETEEAKVEEEEPAADAASKPDEKAVGESRKVVYVDDEEGEKKS